MRAKMKECDGEECMKQIIELINQVVTMSSMLVRSGGPVIRGNIVSRIRRMARGGIWVTMRV